MRRWTLEEIRTKINQDLDLEAEDFIQPSELLAIINEGIDRAEAIIHKFKRENEYFLAKSTIDLVQGQQEYDLPADIYANRIHALIYENGSTIYVLKRLRSLERFSDAIVIQKYGGTDYYRYLLMHASAAANYKAALYPPARETLAGAIKCFYTRNANRLVLETDVCDIPEFVYFVIAWAKYQVLFKEGHPNTMEAKMELDAQQELMESTLGEMVPDDDDELQKDFDHYENSV